MLLKQYKDAGLLFNSNFLEQSNNTGTWGYRGELVLIPGEVADAKGHVKPPVEVMRGVVLLADDKLRMVVGAIDQMSSLQTFIDRYRDDFSPEMRALIYVVNLSVSCQVEIEGIRFVLIPLIQGVPWNEVIDELGLEKSDFKGQSAADKIVTLLDELKSYKPKYPEISLDETMASVTDVVREGWGAI